LFAVAKALRHGCGEVRLVDDVLAIEHRTRPPPAELHDLTRRPAVL